MCELSVRLNKLRKTITHGENATEWGSVQYTFVTKERVTMNRQAGNRKRTRRKYKVWRRNRMNILYKQACVMDWQKCGIGERPRM